VVAFLLVWALLLPGCQKASPPSTEPAPAAANEGELAPLVTVQDEDYALARSRFRTRLVRKGPAPQPWSPVTAPPGVTEVTFPSGDLRLKAWLQRPANPARKHPAVLFLHGGFAFGLDDWRSSQPYRDAGFVVLAPMLRGENGQPGAFTFCYDEVDDVLAAADYLGKQPYVDPEHLYIAGTSAGGTLVLLAAQASKCFRAAGSFSASPDQALLCKHAKNAARDVPFDISDRRELELRSPLAYAGSFKCPVRIYYGSRDHFVLTSKRTAELAREKGLDVEAVRIEGDHGTSVPPAIKQSIVFFQRR
jgi:dipeptidyl aminopeptidase/acylaminoacyl peptidase